jgi:hypothetical protein
MSLPPQSPGRADGSFEEAIQRSTGRSSCLLKMRRTMDYSPHASQTQEKPYFSRFPHTSDRSLLRLLRHPEYLVDRGDSIDHFLNTVAVKRVHASL